MAPNPEQPTDPGAFDMSKLSKLMPWGGGDGGVDMNAQIDQLLTDNGTGAYTGKLATPPSAAPVLTAGGAPGGTPWVPGMPIEGGGGGPHPMPAPGPAGPARVAMPAPGPGMPTTPPGGEAAPPAAAAPPVSRPGAPPMGQPPGGRPSMRALRGGGRRPGGRRY